MPLTVAIAQIGLSTGEMRPENAAALVGAGLLSVLAFPMLAATIGRRGAVRPAAGGVTPGGGAGGRTG